MEVTFLTYFSMKPGLGEIELINAWFSQITMIGFIEVLLLMGSIWAALPVLFIIGDFSVDHLQPIYLYLSFFTLSIHM